MRCHSEPLPAFVWALLFILFDLVPVTVMFISRVAEMLLISPSSPARHRVHPTGATPTEEDYVEAEIDVVLTNMDPSLALYLAQYPLRPPWRPYDPDDLEHVRFKKQHHIVEMDYRFSHGVSDGMEVEDDLMDDDSSIRTLDRAGNEIKRKLKQHTLRSSSVPLRTNYAFGVYRDRTLYLTPLTGILQMRPSFSSLEDQEEKRKRQQEEIEVAQKAEMGSEFKPVGIQVKKNRDSERAVAARNKSFAHIKGQEEEEPFKQLEYVDRDREESVHIFEQIAGTTGVSAAAFDVSRQDYLAMINPVQRYLEEEERERLVKELQLQAQNADARNAHESDSIPRLTSIGAAKVLDLPMQVKAILWSAGIATFSTLRRLTTASSDAELLRVLEQNCSWVSGRWVLKSELVCKSDRLINARQKLLVTWAENPATFINRRILANSWSISQEVLKPILEPIADLVQSQGWKLKLLSDGLPKQHYSALETKYAKIWREVGLLLEKQLEAARQQTGGRTVAVSYDHAVDAPRLAIDTETAKELFSVFKDMLVNHGVLRLDFIRRTLQDKVNAGELPHVPKNISDGVLKQELSALAEMVHDVWVRRCGSEFWHLKDDIYRRPLYDLFAQAKDRRIKRKDVESAVFEKTGSSIPRQTYMALMKELSFPHGSFWVLKTGDGTATQPEAQLESAPAEHVILDD